MKITLLIIGLVFLFISARLEKEREFSWRLIWRDFFLMTGAIFLSSCYSLGVLECSISSPKVEESKPITITLTSGTPGIVIHEILEKEFKIQELDTINDTTYIITLCKRQINEK